MKIQGPLGFKSLPRTSPSNLRGVRFLMFLDPLNGPRPCLGRLGPIDPLKPQHNWVQGASNSPHKQQHMVHGPQPADHRTPEDQMNPKRPEMALKQEVSRLAMVMARTKNHKNGPKWPQSHSWAIFQGQWGQDPSFEVSRIFTQGKKDPKYQAGQITMRYRCIYSLAINF
ncbi:hypothetical protein O181_023665 [Austropuccinia psidii MF-1]|uniref:Uncharacterized protein n=1 Tax=Austropuccinia psidii MF-1 TaxID=1389203 RepID=A0A9Q3CIY8_9BASI|nr:hypothetical protein [Austropuccinia psidii MF-1]